MILKLKIKQPKYSKRDKTYVWIQRHKKIKDDIDQLLEFFKGQITVSKKRKFHSFYRITSDNPAILLSLFSTVQELLPEIYFQPEDSVEIEKSINS